MEIDNSNVKQSPFQRFELKFFRIAEDGLDKEFYKPKILIDDEPIREKLPVDLRQLVQALSSSGTFDIFTCGCGSAACAGVEEGVKVCQHDEEIEWAYRLPQSSDGFGTAGVDRYEAWIAGSKEIHHTFKKGQIIFSVLHALGEADILHGPNAEYVPYGFERSHITELLRTVDALFKEQPLDLTNLPFDPALEVARSATGCTTNMEMKVVKDDECGH